MLGVLYQFMLQRQHPLTPIKFSGCAALVMGRYEVVGRNRNMHASTVTGPVLTRALL
jgi:hypothetical protein